jgi:hypothetical protein
LPFIDMQFIVIRQPKWGSTVTDQNARPLRAAERVLRGLIVLNLLVGFGILVMLITSWLAGEFFLTAMGVPPADHRSALVGAMQRLMIYGILASAITHIPLTSLLEITESVREGDPFVIENAARLRVIAWATLGLQMLRLGFGLLPRTTRVGGTSIDFDVDWSFAPWVAVLLLFVLARVFEHGAHMRDELRGTI